VKCTNCGREASGKFCSNCGVALGGVACPNCGHEPPAGARFCNQCGGPLGARPTASPPAADDGAPAAAKGATAPAARKPSPAPAKRARDSASGDGGDNTLWVVGGVVLVGITLVALYPIFSPQNKNVGDPQQTSQTAPGTGPSGVDLTQMTPREAADRLFDRVMRAVAAGDTQEATNFLPMAINAYDMARPLDLDGRHHVAMLKLEGGDNEGALAEAEAGLEEYPNHLLLLGAAAEAQLAMGDTAQARTYYQRMLDAWDEELPSARSEYELHAGLQPILRQSAEELLGG